MYFLRHLRRQLRAMMALHGLGSGPYWAVTYSWYLTLYLAYVAVLVAVGSAVGLTIFTVNSAGAWQLFVSYP